MSDLSSGNHANLILAVGDVYTVNAVGQTTVQVIYGGPNGTTTLNSQAQDFGPYSAPAKLKVTAVTGSCSYAIKGVTPLVKSPNPITGLDELTAADRQVIVNSGGSAGSANAVLRKIKASMIKAASLTNQPLLAPAAYAANTAYWAGEVLANGSDAYIALIENGTTGAASTPNSTTGAIITDGGQKWVYYGPTAADPTSDVVSASIAVPNAALTKKVYAVAGGVPNTNNMTFSGGTPTRVSGTNRVITPSTLGTSAGNAGGNYSSYASYMDFVTDGDFVGIGSDTQAPNQWYKFRVHIDDKPLTLGALRSPGGIGTFAANIQFKGRKERRIRVSSYLAYAWETVFVKPGANVWAPVNPDRWRMVVNGCSLDAGLIGSSLDQPAAWPNRAARLLGCDDIINVAVVGTGFINPGVTLTYDGRLADVISFAPDVYVVGNAYNDATMIGSATITAAQLQAAIYSHMVAARAGLPNAILVLTGVDGAASGPSAAVLSAEAATLAAYNQYVAAFPADRLIRYIPVSNDPAGAWLDGSGTIGSQTGSGNSDYYTNASDIHPWYGGMDYRAKRYAAALRSAFGNLFAQFGI